MAKIIDEDNHWVGGNYTVFVQTVSNISIDITIT
jgi:hypothetical protein